AAADHRDPRALPDLRCVENGSDSGGDGAADETGLLRREILGERNRGGTVHECACRKRSELQALRKRLTIRAMQPLADSRRRSTAALIAPGTPATKTAR